MEKRHIEDIKKRLREINSIISDLDPAIRSAAFDLLAPLYFRDSGEPVSDKKSSKDKKQATKTEHPDDLKTFCEAYSHDKANINVHLLAAWLYSQHGLFPITRKDINDLAAENSLTIPERPDKTMDTAKHKKKNLYRKHGVGWQLTVHGESFLKKKYDVKKGNKPRLSESS
jgi:hypothetical protein